MHYSKIVYHFFIIMFLVPVAVMASEPLSGTLRSTNGRALKGIKVFVDNPKEAVKSDKNGEFRLEGVAVDDSIHVVYRKKIHSFAVNDRKDVILVVGEDGRIFESNNYIGETFHGQIVDYKSKPIRGTVVYTNNPFDYVKSNSEGKFLIDNIVETDTIHVKHDGYIHDIAMDGSKGMFIKIMRGTGRRDDRELVNSGMGMMDFRSYNGPHGTMTAEQLERTGTQNLIEAMSGMSGVRVYRDKKYGDYHISIRNGGSPMWIVDGFRVEGTPDITVMEVKRVDVLHDGMGYGLGACGGVIIVTTKGNNF